MSLLRNITRGTVVAHEVRSASSAWERTVGLIGAQDLPAGSGLWLEPCSTVHTIGMRFAIDVVLLNKSGRVLAVAPNVPPLRPFVSHRSTAIIVELPAGSTLESMNIGDELVLEHSRSRRCAADTKIWKSLAFNLATALCRRVVIDKTERGDIAHFLTSTSCNTPARGQGLRIPHCIT
jgi:uncharacterized membrane protein (UPF0127 family)